jgi:hypothetical protein
MTGGASVVRLSHWLIGLVTLLAGAVLLLGLASLLSLVTFERLTGYHAAVFGPDGRSVYLVARETRGVTWGLGHESLTPPASAYAFSDVVSLRRLDLDSGAVEVLLRWKNSPLHQRVVSNYRGRIFEYLRASLRLQDDGTLAYRIGLSLSEVPRSRPYNIVGHWPVGAGAPEPAAGWRAGDPGPIGDSAPVLSGDVELIAFPGPESYPALIAYDHAAQRYEILLEPPGFARRHPEGIELARIEERARRDRILRLREMRLAEAEIKAGFLAQGLGEGDAILATNREMRRLGYYPKRPTLTARRLAAADLATARPPLRVTIATAEMASGIFTDIESAIAQPGEPVEKVFTDYVVHHDYQTSARLNAHLASGQRVFWVDYGEETYELTITHP